MNSITTDILPATPPETKRRHWLVNATARLVKEKPLGTVGAVIFLLLLLTGIFADFLAPYGYNEIRPVDAMKPPSAEYLLGTDNLGRDMLSRVIYGARVSMIVGLVASSIAMAISIIIGGISGLMGGKFDILAQRFVDAFMCFPALILLIVLMSIIGGGLWNVCFVLGLQYGITGSRIVRSAVISIKENIYVEAARAIGCSPARLFIRHILPNIMAPLIILFTTRMPAVILAEASLSFLGFGVPPPMPSWGGMLSGAGRTHMLLAPWIAIWPGLAISTVIYGINMFGDAVRDILDPRLRGGLGRYGGVKVKEPQVQSSKG
ncbi:ABC transporter permease [Chloroflexota bacterium]